MSDVDAVSKNEKTHQCQAAEKNHSYNGRLKILVFNQLKRFQAEVAPTLPKWRIIVSRKKGKPFVTMVGTTVRWIVLQHNIFHVGIYNHIDFGYAFTFFVLFLFTVFWKSQRSWIKFCNFVFNPFFQTFN